MILTGVTLNLVAGSNGIIMRAISATQEHQKSADKEMLELWYVGFILDNGMTTEITTEDIKDSLKASGIEAEVIQKEDDIFQVTLNDSKNTFLIDITNGNITYISSDEDKKDDIDTPKQYTIIYDATGGKVSPENETVNDGEIISMPTPTKNGYVFEGWYTAETGGNKIGNAGDSYVLSKDETVYAHWSEIKVSSINLDKTEIVLTYGQSATLTATTGPSEASNTNINWSTSDSDICSVSSSTSASGEQVTLVVNKAGTAIIRAIAADGSGKTMDCTVTITPKSMTDLTVTAEPDNYTYTGKLVKANIVVKDGSTILTEGIDYTVAGIEGVAAGTYEATVTGIGNYIGSVNITYTIKPGSGGIILPPGEYRKYVKINIK